MKIYHYNQNGYYCGQDIADESPLEPGVFLIPAFATDEKPPELGVNQLARFVNDEWVVEDMLIIEPEPAPEPPTEEEIKAEKISRLDSEYQPQFTTLSQALGMATLAENTDLIARIKVDYLELKAEYDTKRGGIIGS